MTKFETTFRGYNKDQVDKYILELESKYDNTLRDQKDRIFNLVDDISTLNDQLKQYKLDEQAISKSLVESQRLASELKYDADRYNQLTLRKAKIFYATWQTYAKTLLATLTDSEVRQFNALSDKIGNLINCSEGTETNISIGGAVATVAETTACNDANPIVRVQNMSQQSIDPRELIDNDLSLEQLCKDLGLMDN